MKMKDNKSLYYFEWAFVIIQYIKSMDKPVKRYELFTPFLIALIFSIIYFVNGYLKIALDKMTDILPNVLSILIGFTITILMIVPTIESSLLTFKKNSSDELTPYEQLVSQFSYSVLSEVVLLLIVFMYLAFKGLDISFNNLYYLCFFFIEVFMLLNILLSTIRSITNMFLIFSVKKHR